MSDPSTADSVDATRPGAAGRQRLRASPTVAHWLSALEAGQDVGHYGRLAFAIVAQHFLADDQTASLLAGQPKYDQARAAKLLERVRAHGYAPPSRLRLSQWQARQQFPLLPDPADPASGNLYRELEFPDSVYGQIEEFWEGADG
jgi:hypothetical protein